MYRETIFSLIRNQVSAVLTWAKSPFKNIHLMLLMAAWMVDFFKRICLVMETSVCCISLVLRHESREQYASQSSPLCFRSALRGASRGILQIFSASLTAAVERGAAVARIRPSLPASLAKSSGRSKTGQVRVPGEALAVSAEPERGLSVPQHLRSSSARGWVRAVTRTGVLSLESRQHWLLDPICKVRLFGK